MAQRSRRNGRAELDQFLLGYTRTTLRRACTQTKRQAAGLNVTVWLYRLGEWGQLPDEQVEGLWESQRLQSDRSLCGLLLKDVFQLSSKQYKDVRTAFESTSTLGPTGIYKSNDGSVDYAIVVELPDESASNQSIQTAGIAALAALAAGSVVGGLTKTAYERKLLKERDIIQRLNKEDGKQSEDIRELEKSISPLKSGQESAGTIERLNQAGQKEVARSTGERRSLESGESNLQIEHDAKIQEYVQQKEQKWRATLDKLEHESRNLLEEKKELNQKVSSLEAVLKQTADTLNRQARAREEEQGNFRKELQQRSEKADSEAVKYLKKEKGYQELQRSSDQIQTKIRNLENARTQCLENEKIQKEATTKQLKHLTKLLALNKNDSERREIIAEKNNLQRSLEQCQKTSETQAREFETEKSELEKKLTDAQRYNVEIEAEMLRMEREYKAERHSLYKENFASTQKLEAIENKFINLTSEYEALNRTNEKVTDERVCQIVSEKLKMIEPKIRKNISSGRPVSDVGMCQEIEHELNKIAIWLAIDQAYKTVLDARLEPLAEIRRKIEQLTEDGNRTKLEDCARTTWTFEGDSDSVSNAFLDIRARVKAELRIILSTIKSKEQRSFEELIDEIVDGYTSKEEQEFKNLLERFRESELHKRTVCNKEPAIKPGSRDQPLKVISDRNQITQNAQRLYQNPPPSSVTRRQKLPTASADEAATSPQSHSPTTGDQTVEDDASGDSVEI